MAALPANQTFEALKDEILRYLKLEDDTDADVIAADGLREALTSLAAMPVKALRATAELTLTADEHTVTIPTDFSMPLSLHFLNTSDRRDGRVVFRREEEFDHIIHDDEGISGTPQVYTYRGGGTLLEFDKAPTTEDVTVRPKVRLRYLRRVDTLVTSTATFDLSAEVERYLVWGGRSYLASIYDAARFPLADQMQNRWKGFVMKRDALQDDQDWT